MSSIKRVLVLILIVGIFFLYGCERGAREEKETGLVTIRYATFEYMPNQREMHKDMLREFNKKHPNIRVKIDYCNPDKILIQMAGNTAPDVFLGSPLSTPTFIAKGQVIDIERFLVSDSKDVEINDFYVFAFNACRFEGKLYALPIQIGYTITYYNKDIFDKEGIGYPEEVWTWEDYKDIARRLTKDYNNDGRIDQFGTMIPNWGLLAATLGVEFFDYNYTKILFDTPQFRKLLKYQIDMIEEGIVPTYLEAGEYGGSSQMFLSGRMAMEIQSVWLLSEMLKIKDFDWDIAPPPREKRSDRPKAGAVVQMNLISSQSMFPEAAWKFVKFYASKRGQMIQAQLRNCIPARRSVATVPPFNSPPPDHMIFLLRDLENAEFKFGQNPEKASLGNEWDQKIRGDEFDKLYAGKQTVEETVKNMVEKTRRLLKEER